MTKTLFLLDCCTLNKPTTVPESCLFSSSKCDTSTRNNYKSRCLAPSKIDDGIRKKYESRMHCPGYLVEVLDVFLHDAIGRKWIAARNLLLCSRLTPPCAAHRYSRSSDNPSSRYISVYIARPGIDAGDFSRSHPLRHPPTLPTHPPNSGTTIVPWYYIFLAHFPGY